MLRIVPDEAARAELAFTIDEICRLGAQQMLAVALEVEADAYIEAATGSRDQAGRALVVRNGKARPRQVVTGAGAIEVTAPRVNDRRTKEETGNRRRFRSQVLPPYVRRSPKVAEVLPLLYLHGLSSLDFVPALAEFFGTEAGLSASVIAKLTKAWAAECEAFAKRSLKGKDLVYIWVDGVHFTIRLGEDDRLCCLVIVGVRADGTKELVAIADGYRESTTSWAELLRECKRRGMRAPVLAVGDGALGFWAAVRDVFPATRHQRDWVHMTANVLDCLPASVQAQARRAIAEITCAENKAEASMAVDRFEKEFGAKCPKATQKITREREALLAFYDFPAEHWIHLRTSNAIESTFAPVRARTDVTKGPGSRAAGLAMVFKLLQAAEGRWRKVNAPHLVALVRAGRDVREREAGGAERGRRRRVITRHRSTTFDNCSRLPEGGRWRVDGSPRSNRQGRPERRVSRVRAGRQGSIIQPLAGSRPETRGPYLRGRRLGSLCHDASQAPSPCRRGFGLGREQAAR